MQVHAIRSDWLAMIPRQLSPFPNSLFIFSLSGESDMKFLKIAFFRVTIFP
jgi:hypothetical protein